MEKYPRDLLQKFLLSRGGNNIDNTKTQQQQQNAHHHHHSEGEEEEDEGIELSLGLSLGGRFGVDKHANKNKLMRSSSVVGTMPLLREDAAASAVAAPAAPAYHMLVRASSLPTETEEQWRKRKELQTLRRMEAKRRRSEKQRVNKSERDTGASSGGGSGSLEEADGGMKLNRCDSSTPSFVLQNLGVGTTKQVVLGDVMGKGKIGVGFQGLFTQPSSQGSADSQGGSSSSLSEMDSKPFLGSSSCGEARSPGSNQSQDAMPVGSSVAKTNENIGRTSSKAEVEKNASKKPNMGREIGTNSVEDMPCVFTKGEGPNGRRIEGILYKYGKGEEVRIMCVCHGNFLSPAEFVKHAGGGDVEYPLRHIVINPSAAPFS